LAEKQASAPAAGEAQADQFIQAAIDQAPEPLRRLGEYLSRVLDEDQWASAERMLLGACNAASKASAEELVRYCPGCGSVGPVEGEYRDCCPDGGEARMIPAPLAEKCRDTFKIAVKALLADAAANEARANHVPSATEEHTLRAMARNYTDRHLWDQLDSKTIIAAADEIRALRGALTVRAQPAEHGGAHG
jgi:hypothetical protein